MSKAYSNKALPSGTIIREWRLEDVLGVGGFGIVYKGRGIYFGELVAIKEYFPSSIAERDAESTVVPIGSDVEEVHALGLKKFVEEAKLLWNLSTPTRHPNIVSVRSLFEIHGTAYMVMDFEDGVSLSRLLKEGRRFNERSLWNIIKPVAEGLDRAHRVGVLHRDIKPPNILITDDNRPVLIDFGSARFEAAEATSTSVTFHTPPYAALEQYVKTYPQGPWTDIYAMAVVLYECVTGEKPPEVLERLHAGLGTALADGHWPGFSKRFLQAIDAGMTIKPSDRPQSIQEWLALFGKKEGDDPITEDEATRFFAHEVSSEAITPVAPPAPGYEPKELETQVPDDPKEVQFKRAGEETGAKKKKKDAEAEGDGGSEAAAAAAAAAATAAGAAVAAAALADKEEVKDAPAKQEAPAKEPPKKVVPPKAKSESEPWFKDKKKAMLAGGGAIVLLAAVAGGSFMLGGGGPGEGEPLEIPDLSSTEAIPVEGLGQLAEAEKALAEEAKAGGAPATAINDLVTANGQLDQQLAALQPIAEDPAQAAAATAKVEEMKRTATAANIAFASALLRDADAKAQTLPAKARTPAMATALADLRTAVEGSASLTDPVQSLTAARDVLTKSQAFSTALQGAYSAQAKKTDEKLPTAPKATVATTTTTSTIAPAATTAAPVATTTTATPSSGSSGSEGVSGSKRSQLSSIVSSGRSMAKEVIRMGSGGTPTQKTNAGLAKNYDKYLANVADSARGASTDREFDELIKKANQTKAYITFLHKQSSSEN
ncbi:serine/threonine protein kinase [Sphingomonas sp. NSE70-1]|uniref:Serine/threonine protein kinase n=1 Tax=Sphingomonas caseinilyticus TaxID=2908205 RepID=A0ABT0RTI8_9SPHN|nr:serine/threonine-protein kinase [Sphingomonas caseinilyticus]MCL6698328.1 serine/threonine protein kinase [Sphingomonas caseinilyticus]